MTEAEGDDELNSGLSGAVDMLWSLSRRKVLKETLAYEDRALHRFLAR